MTAAREKLAKLLAEITDGLPPENIERIWSATEHCGDCTNVAMTCDVCYADNRRKDADRIISAFPHLGAPTEDGAAPLPFDRDELGRMVREAWVRWAETQPNPKPTWLVPYEALSEPDKEADRQIGEAIARWTMIGCAARHSIRAPTEDVVEAARALSWSYPSGDNSKADREQLAEDIAALVTAHAARLTRERDELESAACNAVESMYSAEGRAEVAESALAAAQKRVGELEVELRKLYDAGRELNAAFYASDLPGSRKRSNDAFYALEAALPSAGAALAGPKEIDNG